MSDTELWSTEYSIRQGFFRVRPLKEAIKANRQCLMDGYSNGYSIIFIGTHEECFGFADQWREMGYCPNLHPIYNYGLN
jgi:hypothetical protein